MSKKSNKEKLEDYIKRKRIIKQEEEHIQNSGDYHPAHPDNK